MRFCIAGTFEADNIDDAMAKLADHFTNLQVYGLLEAPLVFTECNLTIAPVKEADE